jgi:Zn-dependent M16 (insulinase) family peptidase
MSFESVKSHHIAALNITLEEYRHTATGAAHYHLAADNDENVFLVALRTVPQDSTGVAHILEHTALCGSEKYPVRDPFFMMIRRSLNTFMNAFTSSDWTAYPFASKNRKDFDNLLQVYMDAVFFSRLDPLDFAQEGHRVEFEDTENADSDLVFKGVVFNEMKGAMSSIGSQLWQTLSHYLFPTTTYHYNSGGEPENIPDLSYEQLKAFYESHYHPSNAIFFTFGDIPASEHQARFEELGLNRFEQLDEEISVPDEKRYEEPLKVTEHYPVDSTDTQDKTHVLMGWLLGNSTDLKDLLEAQLLSNVLLDNSSSPLQQLLETSEFGSAPSPLCGLEDSNREISFCCGIEGSNPDQADAFEQSVLQKLTQLADDGIEQERLEAVLHQLELHQREIGGDSYPFGLQLIMQAMGPATHRGEPASALDIEPVLAELGQRIKDPDYIKTLIRKLLLDNPHRVLLVMQPDPELHKIRDDSEKARLSSIREQMSDDDKQAVIDQALALQQRQEQVDDAEILPKVTLADVPPDVVELNSDVDDSRDKRLSYYSQGTNGLVYQQLITVLPALSEQQLQLLPLYTQCLTELGVGDKDYLQTQAWQAATCGSLTAYSAIRAHVGAPQDNSAYLVLSGKALNRNADALSDLMARTFNEVHFSETQRLKDLIAQTSSRREQSITGSGHALAMLAASSGMNPTAALSHKLTGLEGIRWLKAFNTALDADALSKELAAIHALVQQQQGQLLAIAEKEHQESIAASLHAAFPGTGNCEGLTLPPLRERALQAWQTNTQVNFCAKSVPSVSVTHEDAAALSVLGGFLRNGYLHRAIREQGGAYGGGATQDFSSASFRFYSYRDPRLTETFADFDQSARWLLDSKHDPQSLEEAVLGVIGSMDKPGSPAGEAKQQFHNRLFGQTREIRQQFRENVLAVSLDDLRRVTERYLLSDEPSLAVVSNETSLNENDSWLQERGIQRHEIG